MKTRKRVLSVLLTLALCLGLLALAPITAHATVPPAAPAATMWDFSSTPPDSSGTYGGGSWSWVQSTKILTLTDLAFTTTAPVTLRMPAGSTIVLNGTNTLTSTFSGANDSYGIYVMSGALTIKGEGSLNAAGGTTGALGAFSMGIYCGGGNLTISDSAAVNATGGTGAGTGIGIRVSGIFAINGSAAVTATCGTSAGSSTGINTFNGSLAISGGTVTATGNSRAIYPNYTVPSGYEYYVNTTTSPSSTKLTGNNSTTIIDSTMYKYAKIVVPPPTYAVTYSPNGGTGTAPTQAHMAANATFAAAAATGLTAPAGKQFKQWNTSSAGTGTAYAPGATVTMPASALTLYAIWEDIPVTKDYFKLWGKTTTWEKTPLNWILLLLCFGWIWMAF